MPSISTLVRGVVVVDLDVLVKHLPLRLARRHEAGEASLDEFHVLLLPRLGEAFGGGTGLVGICVHPDATDLAVSPHEDEAIQRVHARRHRTAGRTAGLADHDIDDPVDEVGDLLYLVRGPLIRAQPIFEKAANGYASFEGPSPTWDMSYTASSP